LGSHCEIVHRGGVGAEDVKSVEVAVWGAIGVCAVSAAKLGRCGW
jgi:hypothetical protein